jgi:hypothetical protein
MNKLRIQEGKHLTGQGRRQVESFAALRAFGWVVYMYVLVVENSLRGSFFIGEKE